MTITFDATYEDGVLKPDRALPLREHQAVRLTIESQGEQLMEVATGNNVPKLTLGERIAALARDLPTEVLDSLPVDGASQHDHYIYGTPKRPESAVVDASARNGICEPSCMSIGDQILVLAHDLPLAALDSLPDDLASQHDHYLYGVPKRPE